MTDDDDGDSDPQQRQQLPEWMLRDLACMTQGGLEVESVSDHDVDQAAHSSGPIADHAQGAVQRVDVDASEKRADAIQSNTDTSAGSAKGTHEVDLDTIDIIVKDGLPTFQHPDGYLMFGGIEGRPSDDGMMVAKFPGIPVPIEVPGMFFRPLKRPKRNDDAMECGEEESPAPDDVVGPDEEEGGQDEGHAGEGERGAEAPAKDEDEAGDAVEGKATRKG